MGTAWHRARAYLKAGAGAFEVGGRWVASEDCRRRDFYPGWAKDDRQKYAVNNAKSPLESHLHRQRHFSAAFLGAFSSLSLLACLSECLLGWEGSWKSPTFRWSRIEYCFVVSDCLHDLSFGSDFLQVLGYAALDCSDARVDALSELYLMLLYAAVVRHSWRPRNWEQSLTIWTGLGLSHWKGCCSSRNSLFAGCRRHLWVSNFDLGYRAFYLR